MTDKLRMGIYRHYKGQLYLVLGIAHDANADDQHGIHSLFVQYMPGGHPQPLPDRTVVVYIGLELDRAHFGPRLAVRTLEDFQAWVHPSDGTICGARELRADGAKPRFEYLGPELTGDMLAVDP